MDTPESLPNGRPASASEASDQSDRMASLVPDTNPTAIDVDGEQGDNEDDAISIETTTDYLLNERPETPPAEHKLGLDINSPWGWSGSSYDDYDVITVHGIRDDYKTTWIDTKGNWILKDNLFKHKSVREIDYSYEIDEESILYKPNGIRILAEKLVDEYAAVRTKLEETETERPIIWVSHDFGGTIVKEALSIAAHNPGRYGKIFMLTTGLIFLDSPHRFKSRDDLEDQLHKLFLFPGPDIKNNTMTKVRHLARQIDVTNQRFLATKLFDRASHFNIFIQDVALSLAARPAGSNALCPDPDDYKNEDLSKANTPFTRYSHMVGHSFEAAGRSRWHQFGHLDFVREGAIPAMDELSSELGAIGAPIQVGYRLIPFQTRLLSLAPPTRQLTSYFDPILPYPPLLEWINDQEPYNSFKKQKLGFNYLHLHGDGNPLVNISDISRLFHVTHDAIAVTETTNPPEKSFIYFEFDQSDSRYRSLSSMLTYMINVMLIRFWREFMDFTYDELHFLSETCAWTVDDLYHIYSRFRNTVPETREVTLFISCFDQCPPEERKWFMDRILSEQRNNIAPYRMIITTSTSEGLGLDQSLQERQVNLMECPLFSKPSDKLSEEFQSGLDSLTAARPVYQELRSQIEDLLQGCHSAPQLGHLVLAWLRTSLRGSSKKEIAATIRKLSPVSATTIVDVFMSSLEPGAKIQAETAFDWIKYAAEPWSPEALIEALKVRMCDDNEIVLEDLDKEAEMAALNKALGGIITVENGDVKFSHPTFYQVTRPGIEQSAESTARIHSSMAATCLRYFQLENAQKTLNQFCSTCLEGSSSETPLDIVVVSHERISLAEYAVRFWPHHYKSSGHFGPKELVYELFNNKQARAAWEVPFWLLSNPFTRINRHYTSTLPVFAMLGLEDLLDEKIESEKSHPWFNDNSWLSITEAIRGGNKGITMKLLNLVEVNEDELQASLFWAAAQNGDEILDALISKVPDPKAFSWPESLMHRATAIGQHKLLTTILESGGDINKIGTYWGAPPTLIAAWRNQTSTLDLILRSDPKPDLTIEDNTGDNLIMAAVRLGKPEIVKLIVDAGADLINGPKAHDMVRAAVRSCSHEVVGILIEGGAKLEVDGEDEQSPLSLAASSGFLECVRVLLDHKADPDANGNAGTALYKAVEKEHLDIVRLLLEHDPKPSMDIAPPNQNSLLICAICTGNTELVSLLIKHGAKVDYVDDSVNRYHKTPLSTAVSEGDLDMVKLIIENGADINYTGGVSDPPFFASLYSKRSRHISSYLLQIEGIDLTWRGSPDGMGSLHGAYNFPEILPGLLEKGAPMNDVSIWGTELHMAARDDHLESVEILLKNDPKPDLEAVLGDNSANREEVGYTPLQVACGNVAFRSAKALLEAGADSRVVTTDKEDLVDILLQGEANSESCEKVLKLLISEPYNLPVDRVNEEGTTRLHRITETTSVAVFRLVMGSKPNLDVRDSKGYTPLTVAISKSNKDVAKYLIGQGASVNILGPSYGSILHLATSLGSLELVKLLFDSGADHDLVDLEYGESLLYTALGIEDAPTLKKMVRYLVDEAKVSINKLGGRLGYPIIRAASITRIAKSPHHTDAKVLRFLIRRKARLDVSDSEGRRAAHFACSSDYSYAIDALVRAGADIESPDKFGRKPIHFAASATYSDCFAYMIEKLKGIDINVKDHDLWTPLMWAARSGSDMTVERILSQGADIWARTRSSEQRPEWSALKLANFGGQFTWRIEELIPKELYRTKPDGSKEAWDEYFHKSRVGHNKEVSCDSCLVEIVGLRWECIECSDSFSLCFKCFAHWSEFHNPEHSFRDIGPLYKEESVASSVRSYSSQEIVPEKQGDVSSESSADVDLENLELDLEY